MKKFLVTILTLVMVFSLPLVTVYADNVELTADGGTLATGDYILDGDITLTNNITINAGATVTIDLNGHVLKGNGIGEVITNYGTLTVKDSNGSLTHKFTVSNDNNQTIWKWTDGAEGGTSLESLMEIPASGQVVIISGGCIIGGSDSNGGGVQIADGGKFTLENGSIVGCHSDYGGGVYIHDNASFTMTGGAILGCDCDVAGAGVFSHESFIMTGGTIAFNNADQYGGGICNYQTTSVCNITGGTIKGNRAVNGGGIYNYSTSCTVSGSHISCNAAGDCGGGVYNNVTNDNIPGVVQITGTTISYNTAGQSGGGILSNGNTTVGTDTVVSNNNATNNGGGIWANKNTLWLLGGTVTGNTAGAAGGGVYYDNAYAFQVGGAAKVTGNTATQTAQAGNVYLASGKTISIYGSLTDGASICVYRAEGDVGVVVQDAKGYAKYFISDQGKNTITSVTRNDSEVLYNIEFSDCVPVLETGDGGLYSDYEAAFSHAMEKVSGSDDETLGLKLLDDISNVTSVITGKELKIDLNGHTITGAGTKSAGVDIFTVSAGGSLELYSSSSQKGVIGGVDTKDSSAYYGAGVVVTEGTFKMDNCIIQNTYSDNNGGAISISGNSSAVLTNCDVIYCFATGYGGGIYVADGAEFSFTNGNLKGNESKEKGGGAIAVIRTGTVALNNVKIIELKDENNSGYGNYANKNYGGHAIFAEGSQSSSDVSVTITGCTIAQYEYYITQGLGDLVFNKASFTMNNSWIDTYSKTDAVVYLLDSNFTMNGGKISGASKDYNTLGCVYVYGKETQSNVKLEGEAIINNENSYNLCLHGKYTLTSGLTDGAIINIVLGSGSGLIGSGSTTDQAQYYTSNNTNYDIFQEGDSIYVDSAAAIGNTGYKTLQYAVSAANGNTVKLKHSVSENITVDAGKTVTLDLCGKTLAAAADGPAITNAGTLAVTGGTVKAGSEDGVAIYNKDTKDENGNVTASGNLTLNEGNYYGSITSDDKTEVALNGGFYSKNPVIYCLDLTKTAVKCLEPGTYPYQVVATDTVNAVGTYYYGDEGFYAYDSLESAIAGMPDTTEDNMGYIAVTNNVTENITINSGYWDVMLLKHTITAKDNDSAVITNKGHLILEDGNITGGSVGIENTGELVLISVSVTGNKTGIRQEGELTVTGSMTVAGNTEKNLYLTENKGFSVTGLRSGSKIGITTEIEPETGKPVTVTSGKYAGESKDKVYFSSDVSNCGFIYNTDHWELVKVPDDVSGAIYCASLTLNDNIDVNFSMTGLGSGFDVNNLAVFVDDAQINGVKYDSDSGKVTCILRSVAPKNMADSMRVVITYNGVSIKLFDYSIRRYCESVFKNTANYGVDSPLGQLCKAVLNYGKYAADYFNEKENKGAAYSTVNSEYEIDFSTTTVTAPEVSVTNNKEVVTYTSAYLTLDSNIILNFRLDTSTALTKDDIIITRNGSPVSADNIIVSATGSGYIVTIKKISASKISDSYTMTIKDIEDSDFKVVYSIYNYCSNIQNDKYTEANGYTTVLKTLCKAIYNYGEASRNYILGS